MQKRDITGGGGTSFIPVFDRLETLDNESLGPLSGLIYFTDGYGRFPLVPPKVQCPIIFILPKDSYGANAPDLPSYVQKSYFN